MFMNEIKSRGSVRSLQSFTYILNWNSYQIKALITLDYLFFLFFFLEWKLVVCRIEICPQKIKASDKTKSATVKQFSGDVKKINQFSYFTLFAHKCNPLFDRKFSLNQMSGTFASCNN